MDAAPRATAPDCDSDDSCEWEEHGDVAGDESAAVAQAAGAVPAAVYVQESSDVQLGPRTIYQAPVNITQHVHVARSESVDLHREALKSPDVHANGTVRYECPVVATVPEKERAAALCRGRRPLWALLGAAALLTTAAVVTVFSQSPALTDAMTRRGDRLDNLPTVPPLDDPLNPNRSLSNRCRILSKEEWGGYEARAIQRLAHPTKYVVISHTVGSTCFDTKTCSYIVRNIQDFHFSQPAYNDIAYNFLVGGDGNVYEGRGWDITSSFTGFVKNQNIGVSFIGNFVRDSPTVIQLESAQLLLELGVRLGKLDKDYKLVAHNQTYATISPGPNIYKIISKWSHFYIPSKEDPA